MILQRYFAVELLKVFAPVSGFFMLMFAIAEFFWRLQDFLAHKTPLTVIASYMALHIPLWFVQSLPIAVMLAVLLTISQFIQTRELTAAKALGIDSRKFFVTWLVFGLLVSLGSYAINDSLAATGFRKAQNILRTEIKREPPEEDTAMMLTYSDTKNVFATILYYVKNTPAIGYIRIERLSSDYKLASSVYAERGTKVDGKWVLHNVFTREYGADGSMTRYTHHNTIPFPLEISVEEFEFDYSGKPLDRLTTSELKNIIRVTGYLGKPVAQYATELNFRFALAAVNFILVLFAIPLAQTISARFGKLTSFLYTIVSLVAYWTLLSFFRSMGSLGTMDPAVAVWIPNAVFLVMGCYLYFVRR